MTKHLRKANHRGCIGFIVFRDEDHIGFCGSSESERQPVTSHHSPKAERQEHWPSAGFPSSVKRKTRLDAPRAGHKPAKVAVKTDRYHSVD